MLKKLHFKSWLLMLCMLVGVGGNLWADDVLYYTLEPASTGGNSSPHNSYTAAATTTIDGIEWSVTGNSNMVPWRIGGKSITDENREVYSQTAMGSAITKVELTVGAASSITVNSLKLIVASDASFSTETQIDEVSKTFTANSTITFTPTSGTEWAEDAYYKFVFNVSVSSTSNKFVEFTRAKFYKAPAEGTTAAPSISGTTEFFSSTTVTLTNAASAEGADIYYTLNGDNPTTTTSATCFKYSSPFELTATTTVKAIAKHADDTNASSVVSKTFTKGTLYSDLAALTALTAAGTYFVTLSDALVTFVATSGTDVNGYMEDASAGICLYKSATNLAVGDKLNGVVKVQYTVFNGLPEVTSIDLLNSEKTTGNTVTPLELTIAELTGDNYNSYISRYVTIKGATVTSAFSSKNSTIEQNGSTIVLHDQNNQATLNTTEGKTVNVTGHPSIFNETKQIALWTQDQIEEVQSTVPYITASDVELECDATSGVIAYTIANPVTGTTLNATTEAEWISNIVVGETITFDVEANEETEARMATITLSYAGAADKTVTVTQAAAPLGDNVIEWDFTKNTPWNFPTDKTVDEKEYTDGTYTIKVAGTTGNGFNYYENGKALLLGKNGAYLTFPAFAKDVEKIEVVGSSGASESVKQNIYVEDTAVSEETTGAKDVTNIYFIADNYQNAGRIYTLKVTSAHNTQITKIRIYLKDTVTPIKKDAGLAYETTSFNVNVGEAFTAPTLTNPNSLAVTYTSSNTDLATVDATGAVTLVTGATGTTTITASFAGNETYLPGEASYTLTVVDPDANDGSAEKPYTVAQALAASPANGVYVRGIVSQIDEVSTEYGNATYWISDDGETTTQIMIYRGKFFGGTSFTSADQIKKGDKVVITGNLIVSNDAKQMAQGNYIVSLAHLRGDVNGDGKVNIADVTTLVNIILGKE